MRVEQSDGEGPGLMVASIAILVGLKDAAIIVIVQNERWFIGQDIDDPAGDALIGQGLT